MSAFCTECGAKIAPEANFCATCGAASRQSEDWADELLGDFIEFLNGDEFGVQSIEIDWKHNFTGPQALSVSKFYFPPQKKKHFRYCMNCDIQLKWIGWHAGRERYLCSECLLDILENRVSWVTPLSMDEYVSNENSAIGCVIPDGDGGYLHIDRVYKLLKKEKNLKCSSLCKNGTSRFETKVFEKGDEVFAVSCNSRSFGLIKLSVCRDCFYDQLSDEKILKKSKGLKQILKLKTRDV